MLNLIKLIKDSFKNENSKSENKTTLLPIPKHLSEILKPIGSKNNEFNVTGQIICTCNSTDFQIKLVGDKSDYEKEKVIKVKELSNNYFLIVKAVCEKCSKEHLVFDMDFLGWNSLWEETKNIERPNTESWECKKCKKHSHTLVVSIQSEGQEDFIKNSEVGVNKNDWVEAFGYITIGLKCNSCNEENEEWISFETM
jgi:hypothetical protein